MGQDLPSGPLAVYVHIPFCLSRCGYCSFFSLPFSAGALAGYLDCLLQEIGLFRRRLGGRISAKTLYFGGGTPSLLDAGQLQAICSCFDLMPDAEVTLEVNPLQITPRFLQALRSTPVNRLSIGVQSLDDSNLEYLGRRHRAAQIPGKLALCRELGYHNISLDLIYGLPGSSPGSVSQEVERFARLAPEHLSCYLLSLDEGSPLAAGIAAGDSAPLPPDDLAADEYAALCETALEQGFQQYEISNFCLPGEASHHNLAYWQSEPWLALGASASGWLPPWRYTNPADLQAYHANIEAERILPDAEECGTERTAADYLMMGLRLMKGIDLTDYQARFGRDLATEKAGQLRKLGELGLLELEQNTLRLSQKALFVSNSVIGELL